MIPHLDLFSGIGGFALAAQMVGGIHTKQFCEIDPYAQKVLSKNFPGVPIHDDITTLSVQPGQYDLITGGFPCQDISSANPNGRGLEGKRSGLFYELMRIVCECRPRYIVLENVSALLSKHKGRDMGTVLWHLSQCGYDAEWQTISAASVGAPHLRKRVFIVAYAEKIQLQRQFNRSRQTQSRGGAWGRGRPEPGVLRVANGIPNRVDRIRGSGDTVVPQVAAIALMRVLELEKVNHLP